MATRSPIAGIALVAWVAACLAGAPAALADWPQFDPGVQVGALRQPEINEASGLAGSRANPGVLWVHNDSGDTPRAFAIDEQGQMLGTYSILGASAVDWEDMAVGPGPTPGQQYLYLGDIGDNLALRGSVLPPIAVYRVPEPEVSLGQTPSVFGLAGAEAVTLTYPDGPRDAETLIVDPLTGDLYVVSKRESLSRVYRVAADDLVHGATVTMEFKCELPWGGATGGDVSPDGQWVVVRGYSNASVWTRPAGGALWEAFGTSPVDAPLVSEPQGESIAFDADGRGYYTVSEGTYQPIYHFAMADPILGDANADGWVDGGDYSIWADNYQATGVPPYSGGGWEFGNFNDDTVVDGADYTLWADNYGSTGLAAGGYGTGGIIPEPATLSLLGLGALALIRRRQSFAAAAAGWVAFAAGDRS